MSKIKAFLLCLLCSFAVPVSAAGVQPADQGYQVIYQASAECGPTSTWLMLHYYYGEGEIQEPEDPRDRFGYRMDSGSLPEMFAGYSSQFFDPSSYEEWVDPLHASLRMRSLREFAERLEKVVDPETGEPLFHVSRNEADTRPSRRDEETRETILSHLRHYLDQGVPSVIHLSRPSVISGHYVTLVGYGKDDDGLYYQYVDTVQPEEGVLRVDHEDMVSGEAWYTQGIFNAYWNGRYLTFWPRDRTVVAPVSVQGLEGSGCHWLYCCTWLSWFWGACLW